MSRDEFKKKYLIDAFFWIDKANHIKIQEILYDFGFVCHVRTGFIRWHESFNNLVTFGPDKFHDFEYYQKVDVWIPGARYGEPKDLKQLFSHYKELKS